MSTLGIIPPSVCHTGASDMEKALLEVLFSNYNLKVRPAVNPEERVVVRVGMILSSFVGLVRHQTITCMHSKQCQLELEMVT